MANKPNLVIVQSYYDRDPRPSKCQPANDIVPVDKKEIVIVKSGQRSEQKTRDRDLTSHVTKGPAPPPPPPPMPAPEFDKSNPPPCPTPDYDSLSISSASSFKHTLNGIHANPKAKCSVNAPINKTVVQCIHSPTTNVQIHNVAKVFPNECANQQSLKTLDNINAKLTPMKNASQNGKSKKYIDGDQVEMISIESFTLNNPSSPKPKPPATYFGTLNGSKKPKSGVSVTIGEYPSSKSDRRRPNKFDFLVSSSSDEKGVPQQTRGAQIGHMLQSELVQTLSRSNLNKQTDNKDLHFNDSSKETVTISINAPTTRPKISNSALEPTVFKFPVSSHGPSHVQPSIKLAADKISATLANNRRLIAVPDVNDGNGTDHSSSGPINGILKNANLTAGSSVTNMNHGKHKNLIQQKSISFGEITTVISDVPS